MWQRFQLSNAIVPGPHECVQDVAFNKRRVAGEPDDIASLIDCCGRVPPWGWSIRINISHGAIFPEHSVSGRMSSNGLVANSGDAHDLTVIIERCGSPRAVSGDQGEILDLIWWSQVPYRGTKLEYLWRDACRIMNIILCPTDHLAQVVGSCGKTVIATWKIGESSH